MITALVTLPAGAIAITILLVDEVDEAFANVYSTTMSMHNIIPQLDRRIIALIIGVTATLLAGLLDFGQLPVIPLPDRLGLRSAVRSRRSGLLLGQPAAMGRVSTSRFRATPVIAWACGSLPISWSIPALCPAGPTSGLGSTSRSDRPARLAWLICGGHRGRWVRDVDWRFALALPAGRPGVTFSHSVSGVELAGSPVLIAHRGFSSRHPEMTRRPFEAAIEWSRETGIPSVWSVMCISAPTMSWCLHDLTLDRTSTSSGRAYDRTVAELKQLDFGSRRIPDAEPEQRELVTLRS